ncbi:lipocalin family protein [Pontibacillus marinus]|uniref:AttH domain-containing protein n=1 Tax=Pontibacillus marinus BH030004 = DSM 16465 TaxID=1385511 RepID=A0A0A5GF34_9BACI|nr:lipocalin family protein [Pontibacillus marinus]KGX90594.1 hypothetical protein N783_19750 [Pontibacillus marinus BH030004 = DSM 16465]
MNENFFEKISLPKDTGPHRKSNIEWWYNYAYLTGDQGGQYAVMASFFRVGETECSKGHYLIFTLIDLNNKTKQNYSIIDSKLKHNMIAMYLPFYLLLNPKDVQIWDLYKDLLLGQVPPPHSQMDKASIQQNPTKLIYGDNELTFMGENEDRFKMHLTDKDFEIDLNFRSLKPISLIGGDGKPDDLYYYSFTRNHVEGQIQTHSGIENVEGVGWFDHQWGRDYGLIKGAGWDWFGLQLEDGRELLLNQMRSGKETFSPMANIIEKDGSVRFTRNISFIEINFWRSFQTNARYPIEWKIKIPEFSMDLHVMAHFPKQEMPIIGPLQAIWEGVCEVSGTEVTSNEGNKEIQGRGFMELVGYA